MNTDTTPQPLGTEIPIPIAGPQTSTGPAPEPQPQTGPGGRPRLLNEVKQREVCALVSAGCGIEGAARYVGCAASTIRREAERNPQFNQALRSAHLSAELNPLNALRRAAQKHWRAAAWLLERFNPQRFAKQDIRQIKPEKLEASLTQMAQVIAAEVKDPTIFRRVCDRFSQILFELDAEIRAVEPDPGGAKLDTPLGPTPFAWPDDDS
jgi:hypothetical protein